MPTYKELEHLSIPKQAQLLLHSASKFAQTGSFNIYNVNMPPWGLASDFPLGERQLVVKAFLLQVSHTQAPQEQNRNPTWQQDARRSSPPNFALLSIAVERLSGGERTVPDYGRALTPPSVGNWPKLGGNMLQKKLMLT
jgi:hypothetical protein